MPVSDADRRLLELHVPQLRYHPNEFYRADSAATFTEAFSPGRHSNELRDGASRKVIAQVRPVVGTARLSLATLVPSGKLYFPGGPKAKKGDFMLGHGDTLKEDWLAARGLPGLADRIYCRIAPGKSGRRWLQYWMYYYDNPFRRFGMGQHQGDWELVQIAVVGGKPKLASYAQHGQCEPRKWENVPTVGRKGIVPIAYVAKDSHATYYDADTHVRIFGTANDHTADGGVVLRPAPYILEDEDRWIHWPGTWGPEGSPGGPPSQRPWKDPEGFHADKVKGGLLAGLEEAAVPGEPELVVGLEQDAVVVAYTVARPAPGRSDPVRLELALYGSGDRPVPSVLAVDVTEARGQVRVPLPFDTGPYTLHSAVYDSEDQELRLAPRSIPVLQGAGLEAAEPRVLRPRPPGRAPIAPTAVRLIVRAPRGGEEDRVLLEQAVARTDELGPRFRVAPLFHGDDRVLRRFLTVSGSPALPPGMDVAAATFEAARRLDLPDGWEVSADPPTGAGNPAPERGEAAAALGDEQDPLDWAIAEMRVREAWAVKRAAAGLAKGAGIVIGQPDTGYTDHPELELDALDRLRDYDVLTGLDDAHAVLRGVPPAAFPSHGTSTASVAVSREEGDIVGSAPQARIVPIRAATSVIHVRNAELAVAVQRAWELGVDVITISMGGVLYPPALQAIIKRAVDDGVIVMAAAGQFVGLVVWPARFPECLGVGGSARHHKPWLLSSVGREVDISAPAKDVWVAATRNAGVDPYHIAQHDGTSFAVALTAGVAALWLAHHGGRDKVAEAVGGPKHVQAAFRALVRRTCTKPAGWDADNRGPGIVDAEALLKASPASWRDAADKPHSPRTTAPGRALDAAAAMAPEGMAPGDANAQVAALFDGDKDKLARFGDEVTYRLAEHAAVRAAVFAPPAAGLEAEAGGRALMRAVASPSLREALG